MSLSPIIGSESSESSAITSVPLIIKSDSQYAIKCKFFSTSCSPLLLYLPRGFKVSLTGFLAGAAITILHPRERPSRT
jgi:hypothetical protein